MHYKPVTAIDDAHLPFLKKLYHEAFPQEERRDWKQLLSMIGTAGEMEVQVIADRDQLIGLIIFWVFGNWCFIEHLAVSPDQRGMKYGERIMRHFMGNRKILLEVEPPSSADAVRRVRFYEKLGLSLLPQVYRQPSYRETGIFYEMELMSNSAENGTGQLDAVLSAVLQKVYGL